MEPEGSEGSSTGPAPEANHSSLYHPILPL
jgi:hypothetical protein